MKDRKTDSDQQTDLKADRRSQTGRQTDRQGVIQIDGHTGSQRGRRTCRWTDRLIERRIQKDDQTGSGAVGQEEKLDTRIVLKESQADRQIRANNCVALLL